MTETKQTGRDVDLQSLSLQALQQEGVDAVKSVAAVLTLRAQGHFVTAAVSQAERIELKARVVELEKQVAKLHADLAAARGEVAHTPVAKKTGKPAR
jgi:cell division protein FtsB